MRYTLLSIFMIICSLTGFGQTVNDDWTPNIIKEIQGYWVTKNTNQTQSFLIIGDRIRDQNGDNWLVKISADSIWTMHENLNEVERLKFKPKVGVMNLYHADANSLVLWHWNYGNKEYVRYYRKED